MSFPKIIYGTAWKKERTTNLVVQAVLQGFRAIDTAGQPKHYQEQLVGDALDTLQQQHGINREDIFLQTKYTSIDGQDTSRPLPYDPTVSVADQVRQSFSNSLKNLRTDYLDSYILHSPLRTPALTLEAWKVLLELQDEGKVHKIGISNCYDTRVLQFLIDNGKRMLDVVQNRWYEENAWDTDVVQFCKTRGIYYESFWTLSGSPNLLQGAAIQDIVRRTGCTPAQALFRTAQIMGVTPLSGTKDEQHMKDGLACVDISLTDADVGGVQKAMKALAPAQKTGIM